MFKKCHRVTDILLCRAHIREEDEDISELAGAGQGRKASSGGSERGCLFPITTSFVYSVPFLLAQDPFQLPTLCGWRGGGET